MIRLFGWISRLGIGLLLAASILVIAGGVSGRPLLLAAVPTASMAPALQPGDVVLVLPRFLAGRPVPGDIVVFRTEADGRWIVHRIVGGDATGGFTTRGDANLSEDPYLVQLQDMAGLVPQWRGVPLRLPGLGALSRAGGPLAHPVVALAAVGLGVYLLVTDTSAGLARLAAGLRAGLPWWECARLGSRRRTNHRRGGAAVGMYGGLAGITFLMTLATSYGMGYAQALQYEVVAQRPANVSLAGQVIAGETRAETLTVQNPSPLPLVIVFSADDANLRFSPAASVVRPRSAASVQVMVRGEGMGRHQATVHQSLFLPLLPPSWLLQLLRWHGLLPAVAIASLPALAVLALALTDGRVRWQLQKTALRWQLR